MPALSIWAAIFGLPALLGCGNAQTIEGVTHLKESNLFGVFEGQWVILLSILPLAVSNQTGPRLSQLTKPFAISNSMAFGSKHRRTRESCSRHLTLSKPYIYIPWCADCDEILTEWVTFAREAAEIGIRAAACDTSKQPGIAGRFLVADVPRILHIDDGAVRCIPESIQVAELITYMAGKEWEQIKPISWWLEPHRYHMNLAAGFFTFSENIKELLVELMREYHLSPWFVYVLAFVAAVAVGLAAGSLIVMVFDLLWKVKPRRAHSKTDAGLQEPTVERDPPPARAVTVLAARYSSDDPEEKGTTEECLELCTPVFSSGVADVSHMSDQIPSTARRSKIQKLGDDGHRRSSTEQGDSTAFSSAFGAEGAMEKVLCNK